MKPTQQDQKKINAHKSSLRAAHEQSKKETKRLECAIRNIKMYEDTLENLKDYIEFNTSTTKEDKPSYKNGVKDAVAQLKMLKAHIDECIEWTLNPKEYMSLDCIDSKKAIAVAEKTKAKK